MRECPVVAIIRPGYRLLLIPVALICVMAVVGCQADHDIAVAPGWKHLTSAEGDLPTPMGGNEQTASLLVDIDGNGIDDVVISERTAAPSVVWLRREGSGWSRLVIDDTVRRIEAGGASHDIDRDGDPDILFGGDSRSAEVWWWENPKPNFDPVRPWRRRLVKNAGMAKHHDELFVDVDGDGTRELVFWNQGAKSLMLAEIPESPRSARSWPARAIYTWDDDAEHEGLAAADIDGDGTHDIVGGGNWYRHEGDGEFSTHLIDPAARFTRSAAGQLKPGGRPEVVFGPGDADGVLKWYEWNGAYWVGHVLEERIRHGHSLAIEDLDSNGELDVFVAEMGRWGRSNANANARTIVYYGDGTGAFRRSVIARGIGNHESRLGDLDGDGDIDILGKPYNWRTPRVDVLLNGGTGAGPVRAVALPLERWRRHEIDKLPYRATHVLAGDIDGDGRTDIAAGGWWWSRVDSPGGKWIRHEIGRGLSNVAALHDLDGDGHLDAFGTNGVGSQAATRLVWARGAVDGTFATPQELAAADGDFLQGIGVVHFRKADQLKLALSWHQERRGIQFLTIPAEPLVGRWTWRRETEVSQDEDLSVGDIDRDGDPDLLLGTIWLENRSGRWLDHVIGEVTAGKPDRNELADLDGDGRLDGVVGLENGTDVLWFRQGEDPHRPWHRDIIGRGVGGGFSMDCADLDGDSDIDVILGEHRGKTRNRVIIYENDSWGRDWKPHVIDAAPKRQIDHHDGTQVVDVDADGDLDLISIGWSTPKLWLYENRAIR